MDPSSSDESQKPQNENQNDSIHIPIQDDEVQDYTFSSNVAAGRDKPQPQSEPQSQGEPQVISPTKIEVSEPAGVNEASTASNSIQQPTSQTASPATPIPSAESLFQPDANAPASVMSPKDTGGKKKAVLFIGILAVVLLLGGAFAAAYYGVIVPNKPENVLRQAVQNTAKQEYVNATAKVDVAPVGSESSSVTAMKFEGKTASDVSNNAYEGSVKVVASGVDVTLDAKYVDKNAYVKVGSLDTVTSLLGASLSGGAENAQIKTELDKAVAVIENQWIEVDSTILDQANASCSLNSDYRFTDNDLKLLEDQFAKHSFISINNHSDDDVNGQKAKKYKLTLDTKKATEFADDKKLEELSFVKKLEECASDDKSVIDPDSLKDSVEENAPKDEKYTFDLWVDSKQKVISKVAFSTDSQTKKPEDYKASVEVVLNYDKVTVTKPEDAKPVMQLFGDLQEASPELFGTLGLLLGGLNSQDGDEDLGIDSSMDSQFGDAIFEGEFSDDL